MSTSGILTGGAIYGIRLLSFTFRLVTYARQHQVTSVLIYTVLMMACAFLQVPKQPSCPERAWHSLLCWSATCHAQWNTSGLTVSCTAHLLVVQACAIH